MLQLGQGHQHAPHLALDQEADVSACRAEDVVTLDLRAGEAVLFDPALLHCSKPNASADRRRCGMTMRYAASCVACDLAVWPHFEAYPVRGAGAGRNPVGKLPTAEGCPVRKFQMSSEFE